MRRPARGAHGRGGRPSRHRSGRAPRTGERTSAAGRLGHRTARDGRRTVISRRTGYLTMCSEPGPPESQQLQREGYVVLSGVFTADEVAELVTDVDRVFDEYPPDERRDDRPDGHWEPFRYEMLNRSAVAQRAAAHRTVLDVVQPLLGEDCHVIANTAWRQPPGESTHG